MISIKEKDHQILNRILEKYPYRFYAYGSRTRNDFRTFSDLDICYQEEIPFEIISQIKEDLEDSNLSIIVQLVSWNKMKPWFKKAIEQDLTALSFSNQR